ncbi:hypothetical protein EMCRGX_G019937 [Ephydatia muelleri]
MKTWAVRLATLLKRSRLALLLVNTTTCCAVGTLGDLCQQRISQSGPNDWARTGRMAALGLCMGPVTHYWYLILDVALPGTKGATVVKKVLANQLLMAPTNYCIFFTGMALLEGHTVHAAVEELQSKFWSTYKMDWLVWPAAQTVNFVFVPPMLRVAYVNMVAFLWATYLSHVKHKTLVR